MSVSEKQEDVLHLHFDTPAPRKPHQRKNNGIRFFIVRVDDLVMKSPTYFCQNFRPPIGGEVAF